MGPSFVALLRSHNLLVRALAIVIHVYLVFIVLDSCLYFYKPISRRVASRSQFIASGKLVGPEDMAYEEGANVLYASCSGGWIKRLAINESSSHWNVEDWVNTGGRPLGIALRRDADGIVVADAYKGLLGISKEGVTEVLVDEADGVKFKLTDGVDVAFDGTIYFTDASYKYSLEDSEIDVIEGIPNGRLMSFDPITRKTKVLIPATYFGNGVAVAPDQNSIVFCETSLLRCNRHFIQGEKKGTTEILVENLPGFPDNIRYDGHGHYLIGLPIAVTFSTRLATRYPLLRNIMAFIVKHVARISFAKDAGILVVDLEGRPVAHYSDPGFKYITGGILIGNHLYLGSLHRPHIIRLEVSWSSWRASS